jgi:hypothetical protein
VEGVIAAAAGSMFVVTVSAADAAEVVASDVASAEITGATAIEDSESAVEGAAEAIVESSTCADSATEDTVATEETSEAERLSAEDSGARATAVAVAAAGPALQEFVAAEFSPGASFVEDSDDAVR